MFPDLLMHAYEIADLACMYKLYESEMEKYYTPTCKESKISASIHLSAFLYACICNSALFFSCSVIPLDVGMSCGNPPGGK
jgi:hypothetical protein